MNKEDFTKTELAILEVLKDGVPHEPAELLLCLNNDMSTKHNLVPHLNSIRKQLRPAGQDIICKSLGRRVQYVWIRLLHHQQLGNGT